MLGLFTFAVDLPGGVEFLASFALGVIPAVVGAAILWAGWRAASAKRDPALERLAGAKDQIIWRALAQGGRITAAEAAPIVGLPELEVEHALMSLVSEGRATAEAGDSGGIVYRIESPISGLGPGNVSG